jgi:hypothetical protein
MRASNPCEGRIRAFDRKSGNAPKSIILLEKRRRTGNRMSAPLKALNQVLRNLIQNLQKLNQKVK